ncbi:hypothetical protein GCM10022286_00520 [Gryllotalpicola daejeonensis]|uniref:Uncharacterized protein n=1 Tax=Gryllotalpicola daejeonensis TaxID=993087 RepID=A0ABP7ZCP7_9MICO
MRRIRASLVAIFAVALLAGCSYLTPKPAVTVTVNPTPTAAAKSDGWIGAESLGATMDYTIFLSWVDDDGQLSGQMQAAYPATSGAQPVTVASATLTGTEVGDEVSLTASNGGSVFGWTGTATGTISSSALDLEGQLLSSFLPAEYEPEGAPQLTLKPGTAADFENAISQLGSYIDDRKRNAESGCPESGC